MAFFDFFKQNDINKGVEKYNGTAGAVLVDVRTPEEYTQGHIPSSINIPLQSINMASSKIKDKNAPLFVYCYSGARSSQAAGMLKSMGYTNVTNIGGIASYNGEVER